ncbi:hypothetical protein [Heyndrickxia sporothermodurans]|uniref:Uncharacterized protein n=1 Tax=Heyndrickxia sporothermodurans TaxID=46224 RepID=A0A150L989_9BACI|nr:hypothetical protein [Heyndrickxia sporothermodurans]MBY0155574.1 hypothetical protein [Cytobacillus firmus]KYD08262.1 hypothetical protein B4102_2835 [Heyndrickxia sporothermodurans]MBL5768557.1 hypothetical protein [Heyndrickxia sporothermodurans]MBL5775977.1 hypothetical protein [Heyndrickxia sporothermodurans]MBL5782769.1 hypothetical protein [Heyndrickxia sporothermodurans]
MELDAFDNQFIADLIHKTVKEVKNSSQLIGQVNIDIYAKVKLAVKRMLIQEKITRKQLEVISNAVMKQVEEQYRDWPRMQSL